MCVCGCECVGWLRFIRFIFMDSHTPSVWLPMNINRRICQLYVCIHMYVCAGVCVWSIICVYAYRVPVSVSGVWLCIKINRSDANCIYLYIYMCVAVSVWRGYDEQVP